jgi:phosphoglycerol transferase
MDLFPSTLAAMGCTIEGERLGLGTNLFSAQDTLAERMGLLALNKEISKRSEYYNESLIGE